MRELAGVVLHELTGVLSFEMCSTVVLSGTLPRLIDLDGRNVEVLLDASERGILSDERPRFFVVFFLASITLFFSEVFAALAALLIIFRCLSRSAAIGTA